MCPYSIPAWSACPSPAPSFKELAAPPFSVKALEPSRNKIAGGLAWAVCPTPSRCHLTTSALQAWPFGG